MRSVRLQDSFQIRLARLLPAVIQVKDIMLLKRVARSKDMKYLFAIEIKTQRIRQALVNLIKAICGNFFSIRFVEKVATKSEIGLPVTDKSQHCRHNIQLLSHFMADSPQGMVRGVHETDDFGMASGRLHVRTRDKAADMVGDEDEQRVFKPRLFRCRFKEFTNGEVGVGDTGLQKIIPLRHFTGIFLRQIERMMGGQRKDSGEKGSFAFVELMRHILKEIHVPNTPNIGAVLARIVFLEVCAIVEFAYSGHLANGFKAHLVFRSSTKETGAVALLLQNARQPFHFTDKLRQKGERSLIGWNGNQYLRQRLDGFHPIAETIGESKSFLHQRIQERRESLAILVDLRHQELGMVFIETLQHKDDDVFFAQVIFEFAIGIMIWREDAVRHVIVEIVTDFEFFGTGCPQDTERIAEHQGSLGSIRGIKGGVAHHDRESFEIKGAPHPEDIQCHTQPQNNKMNGIIQYGLRNARAVIAHFLVKEHHQGDKRDTQQDQIPIFAQRLEDNANRIIVLLEKVQFLDGHPFESIAIIDDIDQIEHHQAEAVGDDIHPKKQFLIPRFAPEFKREQRQGEEGAVEVQDRNGVEFQDTLQQFGQIGPLDMAEQREIIHIEDTMGDYEDEIEDQQPKQ